MKWEKAVLPENSGVILRPPFTNEDWEVEIQLDVLGFEMNENEAREFNQLERENSSNQRFLIEEEGITAGKMRVSESNGEAWIYGFVVFPELQGKGIGRKALSKVVKMEHQKGFSIFLEVEAKNAHALRLYESCGFRSYHSQDYFTYLN